MAKMRSRTEALVNAYLNNYQNANATTVNKGQTAQQSAQSTGSAIMNATDKTLPVLTDYTADVLNGIVKSAGNAQSTAVSNFKLAKKQIEAEQKAAAKAAKSSGKSSKSSKKKSSTDDTDLSSAAVDALAGGGTETASATTTKTSSKTDTKKTKQKSAITKMLEEKQAAANAGANKGKAAGKTYAEQKNAGNTTHALTPSSAAAKQSNGKGAGRGAQSESLTNAAKAVVGALTAPARGGNEDDKKSQYQKRQLVDSGRAFTKDGKINQRYAELEQQDQQRRNATKQEAKDKTAQRMSRVADLAKGAAKQAAGSVLTFFMAPAGGGSAENRQAQHDMRMLMENGLVQNEDGSISEAYQKALDKFEATKNDQDVMTEQFVPALGLVKEGQQQIAQGGEGLTGAGRVAYNVAAMGANMAPGMALGLVNPALGAGYMGLTAAGNKVAEETEKGMGSRDALLRGATSGLISIGTNALPIGEFANITKNGSPILQAALKEGAENAGQEAADYLLNTAADYALKDPDSNFSLQDMASQVGMGAATGAAFGALGGVLNKAVNRGTAAQDVPALQQADEFDTVSQAVDARDSAGRALNLPESRTETSANMPIDAQGAAGYNGINGGVQDDNLGAGVRTDVSVNADAGAGYEPQPGETGSGTVGQSTAEGLDSTTGVLGRGVQGAGAENAAAVAEWAKSITGKNRQSVYTRRIEDLYARMQNGASREELLEEAGNIAAGIVKERDFAEPLDEATTALRDYFKSTPVRLDEKAAGDILSASGLKSIQQYNFQNGTNFSMTKGVPYDSAMMELAEKGTGVKGTSVDDLMAAVQSSNAKPLVDSDMASAYTDYYRDAILNGPSGQEIGGEDFADWLDTKSFDPDAPDYVQRLLERDSLPMLNDTAETVSERVPGLEQPLNGSESVPDNAIGAESTQYNREEVPNLDYANQRVMQGDMDAETAAELGIGQQTHTVYSRAEGRDTAAQDFDVLVQQTGSVTDAGRTVADELNQSIQDNHWDAADVYRGSYAVQQLQQRLSELPEGSAEADVVKAQIANINRAVSAGQSKAGQALVSGRYAQPDEYSGIRRFNQYTQESVDRFANTREGQRLQEVAQDVADNLNGPMDDEFTAFIHDRGIDTGDDVRDQLEYMADQIQRMGRTHHVDINEEQARAAAASLQAGGTVEDIYGAFARQSLGIGELSQDDFDYAVETFRRIADMPDSRERYDLEMSVYNRMANYMPARGFGDRFNNIRYLCMLGNTRTHVRNVLGNVMMGTVVRAKDNVAGLMQLALPQSQRTKAIGTTLTADGRQMVNRAREYAENNMYTTLFQDGRWNMETGLQAARNTYTTPVGRAIGRLSDINGNLLEAEDNYFLRSEFGNSMASFLRARGYDSSIFDATDTHSRAVIRQAAAQALADAREATFHEDNFLSTAFRNFSNDTRRHGPAGQLAYAVVEGILPFKKTPINIAKNALEYNPIGGTIEAVYRGATGQGATRVMDAAAKGVTGTAILGAGYLLAKNGLLTGGASGDDRTDNYNQMLGEQDYAVKIPGKGTYTLDWASPASVPLLIGAQIAKDQDDAGEFNLSQTLDQFRQITQPVLDTTMLQGLNDTLDSVSYADSNDKLATLLTSAVGSFANQFVPTAFGQVARTIDPLRRSTYGGGATKNERDVNYTVSKMGNKIPVLSSKTGSVTIPGTDFTVTKAGEPYIDQWGREQASLDGTDDTAGGMFLRGAYNMFSPGYISSENVTPVDEYLQGLYGSTNDSKVYPEKASSKITVDSEDYYMTPEEKTEYAKTSGQAAYDILDSLRQNQLFLKLPEDQQSELVQKAYSVAKTAGGVAAVGDGVSGVNSKEYQAYQQGGVPTLENYLLAKNAIDVAGDGSDEGLKKADKTKVLLNQNMSGEELYNSYMLLYPKDEKLPAIYSQYGADAAKSWLRYSSAADLDGNGSISQDEAQATLDKMNLTDQLKAAYWQMTNKNWKAKNNPY